MTDEPKVEEEEELEAVEMSSWEFVDRAPAVDEVAVLLKGLPTVWGVETIEFADYVQALPQKKKIKNEKGVLIEHVVYVLYMSVAGRVKMLNAAAELNSWQVDFEPEPGVAVPGYLQFDEQRIVYREYCRVWRAEKKDEKEFYVALGRKPGTAWVPGDGSGSMAKGSNPFEKVETAARGRAIAAWGFGVLPGSGIASLEEMQSAQSPPQRGRQSRERKPKMSRQELEEAVLLVIEEVRQLRDVDHTVQFERMADYVKKSFNTEVAIEEMDESGAPVIVGLDLAKMKEGQMVQLLREVQQRKVALEDEQSKV